MTLCAPIQMLCCCTGAPLASVALERLMQMEGLQEACAAFLRLKSTASGRLVSRDEGKSLCQSSSRVEHSLMFPSTNPAAATASVLQLRVSMFVYIIGSMCARWFT